MSTTRILLALTTAIVLAASATAQSGATPTQLHYAAATGDADRLAALLASGADINAVDHAGNTPLHVAARRLQTGAVRVLLSAGADATAWNASSQTPLAVLGRDARTAEHLATFQDEIAALLVQHGADPADRVQPLTEEDPADADYPTFAEFEQILQAWAASYPGLCELHAIGQSVRSRTLWALHISDNLGTEADEPEFRYISSIHGDEVVGMINCLNLIELLLTGYGGDPRITSLVDDVDIWIMPLMNPDGYVDRRRTNANGVDLNRNFPEGSNGDPNTTVGRQPETAAIMNWAFASSFVCSANFHGGALVVNYPFDDDNKGSTFSPSPDEDMFVYTSEEYSRYNPPMWNSSSFYHGITNGAAWYSISGGLQDWNYRYMGCNDVTIELGESKRPPYSQMPQYWNENRESMLAYVETCLIGVRGLVTDANGGAPLDATITVIGRDHPIYTDPDVGDYHRILLPGLYGLRFEAAGYQSLTVPNVLVTSGPATRLDVQLVREGFLRGDLNCDGLVNFDDINPFVLALTDPVGYAATFPDCNRMHADINADGKVDFNDINPFVNLLTGR